MRRILGLAARYPVPVLLGVGALTVWAFLQLGALQVNVSTEALLPESGRERAAYERLQSSFPQPRESLVVLRGPAVWSEPSLQALWRLHQALPTVEGVESVRSLFSVKRVELIDEQVVSRPLLDGNDLNADSITAARSWAASHPLVRGSLVGTDGRTLAMVLRLTSGVGNSALAEAVDQQLATEQGQFEQILHLGRPVISAQINQRIVDDQRIILPGALLVLFVALALVQRRWFDAVPPLLTAAISITWTLAMMVVLDIPVGLLTAIVPILLVIIGSTEDVHLLADYRSARADGDERQRALARMARRMGLAVTLTFITTFVGFLSIAINDIGVLREFGLVAGFGLLFNFLVTVTVVPAWLSLFGRHKEQLNQEGPALLERVAIAFWGAVRGRQRLVAAVVAVLVAVSVWGATRIKVDTNSLRYFESDSELVQQLDAINGPLGGVHSFSIVFDAAIEGTFLKARYLDLLQQVQKRVADLGLFGATSSFADYISVVNGVMDEAEPGDYYLPESDALIAEYMLFLPHADVASLVTEDYSQARIVVRHGIGSTYELNQALDQLRQVLDEEAEKGLNIYVTGQSVLGAVGADKMASGQAWSLLLIVLAVMLVVSLVFLAFRAGVIASLVNLLPVIVLFGVMGWFNIPLDTATSMVAAIAVGIGIDDTLHFMIRYNGNLQLAKSEQAAIEMTVREESRPIIATSLALAAGFGVLLFSGFPPVRWFGALSAMVMGLAVIATFIILPLLLARSRLLTLWDVLSVGLRRDVLGNSPLFKNMSRWQVRKIIATAEVREFEEDGFLARTGEQGEEMFILLDGGAKVMRNTEVGPQLVKELDAGDVTGEVAPVSHVPRTADVIATEPTRALVLDWDSLERLRKHFPKLSSQFLLNLAALIGARFAATMTKSRS